MHLEEKSYTLDDISAIIGITKAAICNLAIRRNIPHTTMVKGNYRISVYDREAVLKLIKYAQPKKEAKAEIFHTTRELADRANVSIPTIRNIAHRLGIEHEVKYVGEGRTAIYKHEDAERILAQIKKPVKKVVPERLRQEHPLVTDMRCFDFNWWPDPQPKCFKEN